MWFKVHVLNLVSIPGLGRSPGGGHGNPLQYSCLQNPHGQKSLVGYSLQGHKESDTTEQLTTVQLFHNHLVKNLSLLFWILFIFVGEGNGNPLEYSCLENPMAGGTWWAAVRGVVKSRTQLSDFTFTFTFLHWRRKWQPTPGFLPGESRDRGAWRAAVCGIAQSRTWLNWLSSSSSFTFVKNH